MFGFLESLVSRKDALHKLFAVAFTCAVTGLIGFGAFAIGSAIGESTAVGIATGSLAAVSLFPLMFSMLSMPSEGIRTTGDKAPTLQKVFSGLF